MHPHVSEHQNQSCVEFIDALFRCHKESGWKKFIGSCNAAQDALNECLRLEFENKRRTQLDAARTKRKEVLEKWKEVDEYQ
ncbi:COX assembly mitochondrial protein 2 [Zancudomyces culisetae]|uniref:COX assembly mitochondrial protein n=1 Tax=Zancudomyces culisetae TaxID=1213189 RepID=A0A1R1PTP5_ZANCU|nr:COX assembly mitochondrial protein 2 [Zancudomyces culisetae]|eukprot:OMH84283.1 COX assembly mitochondrial protein 2 [Zancudomyces culisetae]